jgi:hypothetical protein
VREILEDGDIKHLAGFAGRALETYNKTAYNMYNEALDYTCRRRNLKRNFESSPWAALTANLGSNIITVPHLDSANLAFGWCAVTALGNFDPVTSKHMVLWDLGIYVHFPPGSTILLPSVLIVHSNLPIMFGETRCSLTQYTAGSLFRWVYNKCQTDKEFDASATVEEKKRRDEDKLQRWEIGLNIIFLKLMTVLEGLEELICLLTDGFMNGIVE